MLLWRADLGLQLSPWVGHSGHHHQSVEQPCGIMECASGSLVVGLGGGSAIHSVLSSVHPIEGRELRVGAIPLSWMISLSALVPILLSQL
jgi:hypothetical protein